MQRRRQWHPTPVLLPGKSHGRRSLLGCSPWGRWESDTTEQLHLHFSLSCIGEGNGNPLQCSCLENPRDGGAWWATVYGVAQSRTWLKWLSSSSSLCKNCGSSFLPDLPIPIHPSLIFLRHISVSVWNIAQIKCLLLHLSGVSYKNLSHIFCTVSSTVLCHSVS